MKQILQNPRRFPEYEESIVDFINIHASDVAFKNEHIDRQFYLHMSNLPEVSINYKSTYNTPIGVFSYPLTKQIAHKYLNATLPYKQEAPYVYVLKSSQSANILYTHKGITLSDYYDKYVPEIHTWFWERTEERVKKEVARLKDSDDRRFYLNELTGTREKWDIDDVYFSTFYGIAKHAVETYKYGGNRIGLLHDIRRAIDVDQGINLLINDILRVGRETAKRDDWLTILWNSTRLVSGQNPRLWTKLLVDIGVDIVVDDKHKGLIHPSEKTQAVFLNPISFKVVESWRNFYKDRVENSRRQNRLFVKDFAKKVANLIAQSKYLSFYYSKYIAMDWDPELRTPLSFLLFIKGVLKQDQYSINVYRIRAFFNNEKTPNDFLHNDDVKTLGAYGSNPYEIQIIRRNPEIFNGAFRKELSRIV